MRDPAVFKTLSRYFFSRFFENDLLEANGDTLTTAVRALAMAAAPGMMIAFFLQNQYPQRTMWGRIEDRYFFVLYSFVVMAGVAIFEWEMLFPDRLDLLVLSPLPLKSRTMLAAKLTSLGCFLGTFLIAANFFGTWMLPAVSHEGVARQFFAHAVAVTAAGAFGALLVIASGGLLICVLPSPVFRLISPFLRMFVVAILGLLVVHYVRFGDGLDQTLDGPTRWANCVPTFWYLGLYEQLLHGASEAGFVASMAARGLWALMITVVIALITYPLAWLRMKRMALENNGGPGGKSGSFVYARLAQWINLGGRRAVLPFIGQTIMRNSRYQVYLAMYCGIGLAFAVACAFTLQPSLSGPRLALSTLGTHAVVPLLVFWTIAGLRIAFALPVSLSARWIFRVTGSNREACIDAGRLWTLACALAVLTLVLVVLGCLGTPARVLLVQALCGMTVSVLIVETLLFADRGIPFAQPRAPGKTSLPLLLTLFIGVLPVFVVGMERLSLWLERKPWWLVAGLLLIPIMRRGAGSLRRQSQPELQDGDEVEGEFQLLGLGSD